MDAMKKFIFMIVSLLFFLSVRAVFETDRAMKAYHNNDLNGAQQLYDTLLVKNPDHYEGLYNSGKLAYKQQNFAQSAAYFEKAAHIKTAPSGLKEQAFFDLGNSYAQIKEWQKALTAFEHVLTINPDNEYAKKTVERIKQIIEQEKQQQEQEKENNDNNNDDKKEDKKESQENNENQQQDDNLQENQDTNQQNKNKENQNKSKEQSGNDQSSGQDKKDEPDSNQANNQKQQQQEQDKQSKKQEEQNMQKGQPDKNQAGNQKRDQGMSAMNAQEDKKDATNKADYETLLLQAVEQADSRMSKLLLQQQLNNEALPYGQKNW